MASEIRVNTFKNRSGLGTVSITDSGASFSGVVTATSFSGNLTGNATGLSGSPTLSIGAGSTSAPSLSPSGDSNTGIFFPSADTIAFGEGGVEALRIDSSGRVGVGTNDPGAKLTVFDSGTSQIRVTSGDTQKATLQINASNTAVTFQSTYLSGGTAARDFVFYDVGTERMKIAGGGGAAGDVTISNGNLVFGTSGKGIDFSANSNAAGMTSELLDDYEEGTWTPALSYGGTACTMNTGSANAGRYVKVGGMCYCTFNMNHTSKNSASGSAALSGFPFSSLDVAQSFYNGYIQLAGGCSLPTGCVGLMLYQTTGNNTSRILVGTTTGHSDLNQSQVAESQTYYGYIVYAVG